MREAKLHVVVMSATLDCREILEFFPGAKCLYVQGRQFPVEIFHVSSPEESYLDAVLHCTLQVTPRNHSKNTLGLLDCLDPPGRRRRRHPGLPDGRGGNRINGDSHSDVFLEARADSAKTSPRRPHNLRRYASRQADEGRSSDEANWTVELEF